MPSFEAVVADPLSEPIPLGWDGAVAAGGHSPLWRAGALTDLAWYDRYRTLMALVRDRSGRPCALFWSRLIGVPNSPLSFHDPRRWPVAGLVEFHLPPGITIGGYAFHRDLDEASRREVLAVVERAIGQRLGRRCLGFAYRQVSDADAATFEHSGHRLRAATPESVLHNEWDSFQGYLRALPNDDRRECQRIRRLVDGDASVHAAVEERLQPQDASMLAHVVRERYRARFRVSVPVPALFFENLNKLDAVRFVTYRDVEGRLLAYGSLLDEGTQLRSYLWGSRERADDGRPNVYFDHFLRQIELFLATGKERLVMGKGMATIKRRFGGRLVHLHTAFRPAHTIGFRTGTRG